MCGEVDNTKWILCSRKIGFKCAYLRFNIRLGFSESRGVVNSLNSDQNTGNLTSCTYFRLF